MMLNQLVLVNELSRTYVGSAWLKVLALIFYSGSLFLLTNKWSWYNLLCFNNVVEKDVSFILIKFTLYILLIIAENCSISITGMIVA